VGYTRIVQYGDVIELYQYEKNRSDNKPRWVSAIAKKRARNIREIAKKSGTYKRTNRSIIRARNNFFKLCHHNNCLATTVHFITLTFAYDLTLKASSRHVAKFMENVKRHYPEIPISYISVSERTKAGRYHFHLLVYDLPSETAQLERKTRNFQRLFQRGYVDISLATYNSMGIAGYMAKYMAKALGESKNEAIRGYSCSRNIAKVTSVGGNTLDHYSGMIIPTDNIASVENSVYDVPYLGLCRFTKIIKNN